MDLYNSTVSIQYRSDIYNNDTCVSRGVFLSFNVFNVDRVRHGIVSDDDCGILVHVVLEVECTVVGSVECCCWQWSS